MAKEKAGETAEAPAGKKSKKMLFIIIAVVVLLGGGVGGFFGYKALIAKEDHAAADKAESEETPPEAYGLEVTIPEKAETFNLKDTRRYISLQLKVVVPAENIEAQENVKKREAQVLDMLINILNEKTVAELKTNEGMEELKQQIRSRITTFIKEDEIQDILIAKYLIQ